MDSIIEAIEDWFRGLLVSGIMSNVTNTFSSLNHQVGEIATEVGRTPASFSPTIFNMIRNLSENVIMPIAGILLTFIACYELIQLVIGHNNLAKDILHEYRDEDLVIIQKHLSEGMSYNDIAQARNCSIDKIKRRFARIREEITEEMLECIQMNCRGGN